MKAVAHRRSASSLERAIALALHDPTTTVAMLEIAWLDGGGKLWT
jgi:hypothetical protein